jgi:hypothetical protein
MPSEDDVDILFLGISEKNGHTVIKICATRLTRVYGS